MGRVIAIANQKGGVGKTTTAVNLSACLAQAGKKVLTIDIDPQGNTTTGIGLDKNKIETTIYDVLLGSATLTDVMCKTQIEGLEVVPSSVDLAGAEIELVGVARREYILKTEVLKISHNYNYVIIDCPPSLNVLTINALTAADSVIVPIQCEYYALEGLSQLMHTIGLVTKRLNTGLHIEGVVFTMYDARTNLSLQVVEEVKKHINKNIFKAIVPRNVRLSEAPSHGMPITLYDAKSKGAESYILLAEMVIALEEDIDG